MAKIADILVEMRATRTNDNIRKQRTTTVFLIICKCQDKTLTRASGYNNCLSNGGID